jgi:dipeptidyl aminopeptidase/acylaminoacyl peptidase
MCRYLLCIILFFVYDHSDAQKKIIDTSVFHERWPSVTGPQINSNGTFCCYTINNDEGAKRKLVVQSISGAWKRAFDNAEPVAFSKNGKWLTFKKNDSVLYLKVGTNTVRVLPEVSDYSLINTKPSDLLACVMHSNKGLIICDAEGKALKKIDFVESYQTDKSGKYLLYRTEEISHSDTSRYLCLLNLAKYTTDTIWKNPIHYSDEELPIALSFSADNKKVAFILENKKDSISFKSLWLYDIKSKIAEKKIDDCLLSKLTSVQGLSSSAPLVVNDGKKILFWVNKKDAPKPENTIVDIWKTTDAILPSTNNHSMYGMPSSSIIYTREYLATINETNGDVLLLTGDHERVQLPEKVDYIQQIFVQHCEGDNREAEWNPQARSTFYVVDLATGSRITMSKEIKNNHLFPEISRTGKWLITYDTCSNNFFSYEMATGKSRNITETINTTWYWEGHDEPQLSVSGTFIWLKDDQMALLYDQYDIWLIDPFGVKQPVSITHGFGRKMKIRFSSALSYDRYPELIIHKGYTLPLFAFNTQNKKSGFYQQIVGEPLNPKQLSMDDYSYNSGGFQYVPLKAASASIYIIKRMSATEVPNIFISHDLKKFVPLTHLQPQKKYNWLTSELHTWKTFDGTYSQGILYKPEDFDSTKKYPVIFNFYERVSDKLNEIEYPGPTDSDINIPWFVSRGYIVFTPDIHYMIGKPGESAYNAIVSCAAYLSNNKWIDNKRMAIQGHSWGGYQVNYIVTRTNIFAAAVEVAGPSDFVSAYGLLSHGDLTRFFIYESTQSRIGGSLWEKPEAFINNSPVFGADQVHTPILMVHNKEDIQVPWVEGVEWFNALRRNGKQAWWLQYKGQGHHLTGKNAIDFTVRLTEFMDHYLKDKPKPIWME